MPGTIDPASTAAHALLDQRQAELRDMTWRMQAHWSNGCGFPGLCPAESTWHRLEVMDRQELLQLIWAAVLLLSANGAAR